MEPDPFREPPFYEHLTAHQIEVCKQLRTHCSYMGTGIRDVDMKQPDLEIDALVSTVDFVNYHRSEQEAIADLPPLGYYEPGLTVDTLLARIRAELPFSDDEVAVLTQTVLKWDEDTGLWGGLSEEEGALVDRWRTWIRESWETEGKKRNSDSAKTVLNLCGKLGQSFSALLPRD